MKSLDLILGEISPFNREIFYGLEVQLIKIILENISERLIQSQIMPPVFFRLSANWEREPQESSEKGVWQRNIYF